MVTGLNQQVNIRFQEVTIHGDRRTVGHQKSRMAAELLDETENIVPPAAVETGGVIFQFVEYLIHLEGRQNVLDEHRRLDGTAGEMQHFLGSDENIVPEARFVVILQFGKVEVRTGAVGY